jgi:hypothetical protein
MVDHTVPYRMGLVFAPVPGKKFPGYDHQSLRDKNHKSGMVRDVQYGTNQTGY